jgi:hypothetical protein
VGRRLRRRREVRGVETSGREARWRSPPKRTRTRRNPTADAAIGQYRIAISAAAEAADLSKRLLLVSSRVWPVPEQCGSGPIFQFGPTVILLARLDPGGHRDRPSSMSLQAALLLPGFYGFHLI